MNDNDDLLKKSMFSQSTFDLQTCVATKESKPGGAKKVRTKSIKEDVRVAKEKKKERTMKRGPDFHLKSPGNHVIQHPRGVLCLTQGLIGKRRAFEVFYNIG